MKTLVRSTVQAWECDVMGHLNSQIYVLRAEEATYALMSEMGFGLRSMEVVRLRIQAIDQHARFLSELRARSSYKVRAGILTIDQAGMTVYCEVVDDSSDTISATMTTVYQVVKLPCGTVAEFDRAFVDTAAYYMTSRPEYATMKGLSQSTPQQSISNEYAVQLGLPMTSAGQVTSNECDHQGFMSTRFFMAHFINAITPLQRSLLCGQDELPGGAVVENRIVYRRFPRAGDMILVRSGFTALSPRIYNFVHWMFDLEHGAMLASSESVALCLDLVKRAATTIPAAMYAEIAQALKPDLTL